MLILLFDIDGTLINTGGAGGAALNEAFREDFDVLRPGKVPFSGRTDRGIGSSLFQLHGIADTHENWLRLRDGYVRRLPAHLARRKGRVLPGVAPLLERLGHVERVAIGLLTGNVRQGARIKLDHFGLHQHFRFGGFGDDHADRDEVARAALGEARATNGHAHEEQLWVIGDTPLDVRCARAIGARMLAVTTGIHPRDELVAARPDVLLDDLSDTQQVLEVLRVEG